MRTPEHVRLLFSFEYVRLKPYFMKVIVRGNTILLLRVSHREGNSERKCENERDNHFPEEIHQSQRIRRQALGDSQELQVTCRKEVGFSLKGRLSKMNEASNGLKESCTATKV